MYVVQDYSPACLFAIIYIYILLYIILLLYIVIYMFHVKHSICETFYI